MTNNGARPILSVDLRRIDFSKAKAASIRNREATGSTAGSFTKLWPGQQVGYKKGRWMLGWGDKGRALDTGTRMVANVGNIGIAWHKWVENDAGKRYPKYEKPALIALGEDIALREQLGDNDPELWEVDDESGEAIDPWKVAFVIPVRFEDETETHHIMFTSKSATRAGHDLFEEAMETMMLKPGEIPVIQLGTKIGSMEKVTGKDARGRDKKKKIEWDIPTMTIVDWTEINDAADNPGPGGLAIDASDDIGEVETRTKAPAKAVQKALPAPATKSSARPPAGNGNVMKALPAPAKAPEKAAPARRKVSVN
jgi:hypothetical protein